MKVDELHKKFERNFTTFFEDFNYLKHSNQTVYVQESDACDKYIYLNITAYEDGLMLEFMLGLTQQKMEYQLSELMGRALHGPNHLSFHVYPDTLDNALPKRQFIKGPEAMELFSTAMEGFFVNKAFYWLDEFSQTKKLSDMLALTMIKGGYSDLNFKLGAIRSLLLKRMLEEQITEDLFFTYLELMQEKGIPEKEIREYLQLKKYFIPHP